MAIPYYPFSALVGQEAVKTALLLNVVDPSLGGVLIRGDKGTGKSTAVRSLRTVLPEIEVVEGCPYQCPPQRPDEMEEGCFRRHQGGEALPRKWAPMRMVELPLNATEDRLAGTLHLEQTLASGARQFEPGLLAAAHRGVLYVDEVNLLADHLVDMLLDAAESGVHYVEREGISYSHPARFVLIGTMNPEEGELRPQFLDRFGLCVQTEEVTVAETRKEIIRRRFAYEAHPSVFAEKWAVEQDLVREQIIAAQQRLVAVVVGEDVLDAAVQLCIEVGARGHRADIKMIKAAAALAALIEKEYIGEAELIEAAYLVLPHRLKQSGLHHFLDARERIAQAVVKIFSPQSYSRPPQEDMVVLEDGISEAEAESIQVPGNFAAGSILFDFLKKKANHN